MNEGFNYEIYADRIREFLPFVSEKDLRWLCNQSGKIYQSFNDNCVDNYRVTRVRSFLGKEHTCAKYQKAIEAGCCGFSDTKVTNPHTGNTFMIGFNYGH